MSSVAAEDEWPESRMETFEMACGRWSASPTRNIKPRESPAVHLRPTSFSTPLGVSAHFS